MIYVIGSGPAGIAAATALLERGLQVTLLDAGVELESEKANTLSELQSIGDKNYFEKLKHPLDSNNLIKLAYGSNYPYAEVAAHFPLETDEHIHCLPSFAQGGLSNVWGAFAEKYTPEKIENWPLSLQQLEPYYEKIFALMNLPAQPLQSSRQAEKLLSHLSNHQEKLAQLGFQFLKANLAVYSKKCIYCGLCQHGCPKELIYSSRDTLKKLLRNARFKYLKNIVVTHTEENSRTSHIYGYNRATREKFTAEATQVFVACGPILSTQIVLRSLGAYQEKIQLCDSSHFMLPCLMRDRVKKTHKESLHTLCQFYLTLNQPEIFSKSVHLQVYTYMDYYFEKIKSTFGLFASLLNPLLDRLIVIQGCLASEDSHQFSMQINQASYKINLNAQLNHQLTPKLKKLVNYLSKQNKLLGFRPIFPLLKISKISKSFHYGASLPMSKQPEKFQTDLLGRPSGLKRLHVVDSSIFPSIPAGSITPTIMANSYRIAAECDIL